MRDRALIALALAAAGCGRIGFDERREPVLTRLPASDLETGDNFGQNVAIAADGNTVAVAARFADGVTPGDNSRPDCGAIYVFARSPDGWSQQAYLTASNAGAGDELGLGLALSADGNTLAAGAPAEDSAIAGAPGDDSSNNAGAVYVFARSGTTWTEEAMLKDTPPATFDNFGFALALTPDGEQLAVSAQLFDPGGVRDAGALRVFDRVGGAWPRRAAFAAASPLVGAVLGVGVALSADGGTIAGGAVSEGADRGAVHVFTGAGATWSEQAVLLPEQAAPVTFGFTIAMNSDASLLASGAPHADGLVLDAGVVHVFARSGAAWELDTTIAADDGLTGDGLGFNVAMSADGRTLAVGAESDSRVQLNGGALRLFERRGARWAQTAYVVPDDLAANQLFGDSVAMSADGATIVVGGRGGTGTAYVLE